MKKLRELKSNMAVNIIGVIILSIVIFGIVVSLLGFLRFSNAFREEYATSTYHMADTAATLVNGDHLSEYLDGERTEEYQRTRRILDTYCKTISVSLIYVIKVDRTDYGRFVSIFNVVDNTVDNSNYVEWELGHKRDTTNDEYRRKYRALYEKKSEYETVYRLRTTDGQHPHITTMVPIEDSYGDVAAILCMQRPFSELWKVNRMYLITVVVATGILSVFAAAFISRFVRKHFVAPVMKVSAEATRFAKENTKGEELGTISRFNELSDLANSIDTMETDMVNYIGNLTAVTAEKERIGAELSFARKIQNDSIPGDFPAFPERTDFDIYGVMIPAKEVGGDFYNFFLVDDDHLALVIGDVAGKGVPAALFMMVTNILLRNRTKEGGTPAEILTYVNSNICEENQSDMFITIWLGILELSTGRLVMANAGHEDAAVCRKGEEFLPFSTKHGFVAGGMTGIVYRDYELRLNKGDKLFLYMDGVPEATDSDHNMFTITRTLKALNEFRDGSPEDILKGVFKRVDEFTGEAPQFDDLTMLCIEYRGQQKQ